jgi:hypothetical protein
MAEEKLRDFYRKQFDAMDGSSACCTAVAVTAPTVGSKRLRDGTH